MVDVLPPPLQKDWQSWQDQYQNSRIQLQISCHRD
jgi:hypothetical protein